MILKSVSLRIESPTAAVLPGRGFYQLEEDTLFVQVGQFSEDRHFFSYLESESERVRFDIDREGRLMLIEVDLPRRRWTVDPGLTIPKIADAADIHWLDFRARIMDPEILTDERRSVLLLRFTESSSWRWYKLTDSVLLQVDANSQLTAVIVTSIDDDFAGRELAAFRKWLKRRVKRERDEDRPGGRYQPAP
jgi:hypothetical protein